MEAGAEVPKELVGVLRVVGELDPKIVAQRVHIRIVVNGGISRDRGFEVDFNDAEVAVVAHARGGNDTWRGWEAAVAAGSAYRLVNGAIGGKAGGASIDVFGGRATKEGGIQDGLRVLLQH